MTSTHTRGRNNDKNNDGEKGKSEDEETNNNIGPSHCNRHKMAVAHGNPADLLPVHLKSQITDWLREDTPSFDYGGFVVGNTPRTASLYCKSQGILAGVPFFDEVFAQCDCSVQWYFKEGDFLNPKEKGGKIKVATVTGPTRKLLLGERVDICLIW
jgi:nicotinate-nucleotide pyrophosphorylase (carboxylating)